MLNSKPVIKTTDKIYKYRFYLLLITLIINFFIPPVFLNELIGIVFKIFTIAILLLSGANFIDKDKKHLRVTWFVFGIIIIGFAVIFNLSHENVIIAIIQYILMTLFFFVITINLLQQIFAIHKVTWDVIIGSFCGYLLVGIISFFLFMLIELFEPGSLSELSNNFNIKVTEVFYFSFTCLTTVGFGDITPENLLSQKLSVLTAAVGQFYIAVVVAIMIIRFMEEEKLG